MTEATVPVESSDVEVMASVDSSPASERFVIADITRDEAWLSVRRTEAPALGEWR